jgi:sugar/nucleoside kinase (ribokinase family)
MKQQRILTFGNVVMDGIYMISGMPGYDEKTFAQSVSWYPGGPAVHFATASAMLGARASVLGWVGDDSIGWQVQHLLESRGVELALHRILNTQTPTAIIMVDQTGEKAVLLSPPIEQGRLPGPEEVAAIDLSQTDHIHTHLYLEPYVQCLLTECERLGISRSLDVEPSSVRRWGVDAVKRVLANINMIFINEAAVNLLGPEGDEMAEKLACISSWGPSIVVCTRGRQGSIVLAGSQYVVSPSIHVMAKSTLAAGDIFASVFIHRYMEDNNVVEAVRCATGASAVAVSHSGSSVYYPSWIEIEEMLKRNPLDIESSEVNT